LFKKKKERFIPNPLLQMMLRLLR